MLLFNYFPFFKKNKDNQANGNISYSGGIRRFTSILIDLVFLMFVLQIIHSVYSYFFIHSQMNDTMIKVIEKYKMNVPLTEEESHIKNKYLYRVLCSQIIQVIVLYIYAVYSWTRYSATLGKFIMGLRVVDATTFEKITLSQSIKRFFSSALSCIPFCIGIIWCNFNKRRQTWHDKIAHTVVVTNKSLKSYHNKQTTL
ncbi:RDD family protein [Ehrlichia ruminantium]|uniref:RDD family protein n=1 Tax=Ehrlichia ruminantium TaxID=779 RepID=A0AAE6QAT3_EHRRU|nr:RDD family protein [Ehrlichia ruminantium]QGR02476.1 RDD family protein [Ehrlichia ruminantium]QGR03398.1 RDD family protein [Ehrlichia ruminantium]QGR04325.1 RDD family protein [Ehrlichia ruminantium]